MELGLKDRVALVTGGSSGIGAATAVAFAREGRVALTYHNNQEGAQATAKRASGDARRTMVLPYDLGDEESSDAAIAGVRKQWEGIDVLVANAVEWSTPSWAPVPFEDLGSKDWERMLRTSLDGVFHTIQSVLPSMRTRPKGRIVLVSSGSVEYGMAGEAPYAAAKAGLQGLSRSLARELGPANILINVVMPGLVATERNLAMIPAEVRDTIAGFNPTGRLSAPDEVAAAILFLASEANGNITGEILHVTGGL